MSYVHRTLRLVVASTLSAAVFTGGFLAAAPAFAADPAPASTDTMKPAPHKGHHFDIETYITRLHDDLKVTDAQKPQWDAVAQSIRDGANASKSTVDQWKQNQSTMTAVDDLKARVAFQQARVDATQKTLTAFQALYATFTPDQQKNADAVFAAAEQRRWDHGHGKHMKKPAAPAANPG